MPKYPETKISILIPDITNKTIDEMLGGLITPNQTYNYNINKIDQEEETNIMVVSDRELSEEEVMKYYMQIMIYHQGIDENLSEKEMDIRDKEVRDKWLNGNFNYWILDEEA